VVQSPPVPRAVHAARSREALIEAALELFAQRGFDATTAEQIAERAGVSPRTFFRYFPTKESVVFHRDYGFMRSFAEAYLAQPPALGDYDALRATFVALCADFSALRSRIVTYRKVVDSSALLVGREHEHLEAHAQTIAEAIVRRSATATDDARTLADVSLALYQRALRRWLAEPARGEPRAELAELVDREFARLRSAVGADGAR
jgi:AcrR family transcriptional regulator